MSQLSAADLQKRHALEGTPDPFPSLNGHSEHRGKPKARSAGAGGSLDTSESAFPALGGGSKSKAAPSAWGAGARERLSRPVVVSQQAAFTDTFDVDQIDLKAQGKDGKATSLGEVMRTVMQKTGATVEASTQRNTGKTTFIVKGPSERAVDSARRQITAALSTVVTKTVDAPASTIGTIIGAKGVQLKEIRDKTNVRIDIPKRDNASLSVPNGDATVQSSRSVSPLAVADADEDEEPTIPITVTGPAPMVQEAIDLIRTIINSRVSKTTQRIKDVEPHVFPFLVAEKEKAEAKVRDEQFGATFEVTIQETLREIVVQGDRAAVVPLIEALKEAKEDLSETLKHVTVSIPRNQHRFVLNPEAADDFMREHHVFVMAASEHGEGITIWGTDNLGSALNDILTKASSQHVQTVTIPGSKAVSIQQYLEQTDYLPTLRQAHLAVEIDISSAEETAKAGQVSVDFIGAREPAKAAVKDFKFFVKKVEDGIKELQIDWQTHRVIQGKHGKKINAFHDSKNVLVFFPPESSESSVVLLVHNPSTTAGNASPASKLKDLNAVAQELQKFAADAADIKTETITIDKKWHSAIIVGKSGNGLDEIVGEEQSLAINFGSRTKMVGKELLAEDEVRIRGASKDVDRAVEAIRVAAAEAQQDAIESSFVTEFDISSEYVGRIVGSGGATINKLRDSLSVKIDFADEAEGGKGGEWTEKSKSKKNAPKVHVTITGKEKNASEARKRILAQVEKFADETQESLHVPREYHPALIGPSGKYVNRMEEVHGVKIFFPRDKDAEGEVKGREALKPNEVLVKGGKKGVAAAKAEILEIVEFEKSNNQTIKFNVPTRSIPRILGRGGANINDIKTRTGAQIDVEREETAPGVSTITVKGSPQETKEAKAAIMAIADEVGEEASEVVIIEAKYHRNFIGKGGEALKQLIIGAGGPEDPKQQAGLIHFPRSGEPENEVRLRGEKKLVAKLKKELEMLAAAQRDRVALGVNVPASLHRALIGRGGQHLNDLQNRTGTQIWFPGSRAYASVGDVDNYSEVEGVPAEDLVKVVGPSAGAKAAIAELASKATTASQPRPERPTTQANVTKTVPVPAKYHHAILQGGQFNRSLRPIGVFVDFDRVPAEFHAARPAAGGSAARIDQDDVPQDVEWVTGPNYVGAEDGEVQWTLKGKNEESLESAEKLLAEAIERAESFSHVGFLTLADRSAFPRIVGAKGSNVQRLRNETDTEITVGKGDNTIIIVGSPSGIEAAKDAILKTASSRREPRD